MDYESIIQNLRNEDVFRLLDQLGAQPIDKENYILCKTICHNENADEASRKLYYYKDTHLFYCYTECEGMSIFKFLRNYYETRGVVYDWYQDILQVILNCSVQEHTTFETYKSQKDDYAVRKVRKKLPTYSEGILDMFTKLYPVEWLKDAIAQSTMDKYHILYSISQNRIIIPHYDVDGDLVGIRGRALNKQDIEQFGKYMPVQIEGKWYSHHLSLNLYGLNCNRANISKTGICYIFESEKSVMQVESFSIPNCAVASCGSNLNKYQIDLLMRYCAPHEIIICYDNEEIKGEDKYFNKLYKICKKYSTYCNMSFIYNREGLLKLKDSPSDNGEKVFLQLLERRIKVK